MTESRITNRFPTKEVKELYSNEHQKTLNHLYKDNGIFGIFQTWSYKIKSKRFTWWIGSPWNIYLDKSSFSVNQVCGLKRIFFSIFFLTFFFFFWIPIFQIIHTLLFKFSCTASHLWTYPGSHVVIVSEILTTKTMRGNGCIPTWKSFYPGLF